MLRRFWLRSIAAASCLAALSSRGSLRADEQQATLNETLRSVLKCRRPEEFAFVDLVTLKVESGQLSRPLVLSMMNWSVKRSREEVARGRRKNDFPFPYFQEGLRRQAAEQGVLLPAFQPNVIP